MQIHLFGKKATYDLFVSGRQRAQDNNRFIVTYMNTNHKLMMTIT